MSHFVHSTTQDGRVFQGNLLEQSGQVSESIIERHADGDFTVLHEADFPSSRLGSADREEYLRVTTSSIIEAQARAKRMASAGAAQ